MNNRAIFFAMLLCLFVAPCCAGQVTLLTGQKDYYFLVGEDAVLPLTLNNTYGHDIGGVLRLITVAEKPDGNTTRTMQEKTFTVFSGQRSYLLPVGKSDVPFTFHCDILFLYPENGGRKASLEDIVVHFVTSSGEVLVNKDPREGSDSPDPEAGSTGRMSRSGATPPPADALRKVQNSQIPQDLKTLQQQIQKEDAASLLQKKEFLSLLMQDSTVVAVNRSLANDGFGLSDPEVSPVTNISGNFSFSYEKNSQSVVVRGSVDGGVLLFADEFSKSVIPLPNPLRENETFRMYESEMAGSGFRRNGTLMHYASGDITVNIEYGDTGSRVLHLKAQIVNGTLTGIEREVPDEPSPFLVPFLSVVLIGLLSGGIVFLSRRIPRPSPAVIEIRPEEEHSGYPAAAEAMLKEAEVMAAGGNYSDAYARAGQALRFLLSQRMSDGRELTNDETRRLLTPQDTGSDRIITTLERCSNVAFAQDAPDPEEFKTILSFIGNLMGRKEAKE